MFFLVSDMQTVSMYLKSFEPIQNISKVIELKFFFIFLKK